MQTLSFCQVQTYYNLITVCVGIYMLWLHIIESFTLVFIFEKKYTANGCAKDELMLK